MNGWQLPERAVIGGKEYPIYTDFRDILEIISRLNRSDEPEFIRWQVAMALFYEGQIPEEHQQEAMEFLGKFLNGGKADGRKAAPKLLDWERDSDLIISDINRVAAREIRLEKHIHWWTFLSWFHAIGEGQLSCVVAIRDKLRRGKKLEGWEKDFYRDNKDRIDLKTPCSAEDLARKRQLIAMLDGK